MDKFAAVEFTACKATPGGGDIRDQEITPEPRDFA